MSSRQSIYRLLFCVFTKPSKPSFVGFVGSSAIETKDRGPDTKLHRLDRSSGYNKIETYNVEVVDWERLVDDVMQIIEQKCTRAYPPYFWLIILGRNGKALDVNAKW